MKKRLIGYLFWLGLAGCLYFFENNTGTRIVLCCTVLLPLIPSFRQLFFSADHAETPMPAAVTVKTFSFPEEEQDSEVRTYQPGDPVNRMHWKLSAKRNEWLIRQTGQEERLEDEKKESTISADGEGTGRKKKRMILFCLAGIVLTLLCLFLIPSANRGAQALCNRLFEASEQKNAYAYDCFPVSPEQPAALAVLLLLLSLALLLGITILSGSRLLALALMTGCAGFQMYFGLAFPDGLSIVLFAAFALFVLKRPWKRRTLWPLILTIVAVSLAVALLCPGVDESMEAASERARDALSLLAQQVTGTAREMPEGENETRRAHTQSLIQGEQEARAEKEYRLETVEEEQISMPRWIDYLKIILLLLAAVALVILPFLPFLWLNARAKKAMEARNAFASENVSEAIYAVFQQIIAWLEAMGCGAGNLPYRDWAQHLPQAMPPGYDRRFGQCAALFEEAAYSDHALSEDQRQQTLSLLHETEQAMLARAGWKQKLRLKYGECLWTEKS